MKGPLPPSTGGDGPFTPWRGTFNGGEGPFTPWRAGCAVTADVCEVCEAITGAGRRSDCPEICARAPRSTRFFAIMKTAALRSSGATDHSEHVASILSQPATAPGPMRDLGNTPLPGREGQPLNRRAGSTPSARDARPGSSARRAAGRPGAPPVPAVSPVSRRAGHSMIAPSRSTCRSPRWATARETGRRPDPAVVSGQASGRATGTRPGHGNPAGPREPGQATGTRPGHGNPARPREPGRATGTRRASRTGRRGASRSLAM